MSLMTNSKELGKFYHAAGPPKAAACRNPLNWPVLAVAVDVKDCDKAVATCGRAIHTYRLTAVFPGLPR